MRHRRPSTSRRRRGARPARCAERARLNQLVDGSHLSCCELLGGAHPLLHRAERAAQVLQSAGELIEPSSLRAFRFLLPTRPVVAHGWCHPFSQVQRPSSVQENRAIAPSEAATGRGGGGHGDAWPPGISFRMGSADGRKVEKSDESSAAPVGVRALTCLGRIGECILYFLTIGLPSTFVEAIAKFGR